WIPSFSADRSAVAYASNVHALGADDVTYTLLAVAATGGTPRALSTSAVEWFPLTGTKALVIDHETKMSALDFDIRVVDFAAKKDPQTIAERIEPAVLLTRDKHNVVYLYSAGDDAAGIYVAPLP